MQPSVGRQPDCGRTDNWPVSRLLGKNHEPEIAGFPVLRRDDGSGAGKDSTGSNSKLPQFANNAIMPQNLPAVLAAGYRCRQAIFGNGQQCG